MPEEGEKNDDRNRDAEQPEQNTATHRNLLIDVSIKPTMRGMVACLTVKTGSKSPSPLREFASSGIRSAA
jgi:hypothetical protein